MAARLFGLLPALWVLAGVGVPLQAAPKEALPSPNLSILVFTSEAAANPGQVGDVERRYLPYLLKLTLDNAGLWGEVRVLPAADPAAEVTLRGRIVHSDGVRLRLAITAQDATGRIWLQEAYQGMAQATLYEDAPPYQPDPFQGLYERIARDLAAALARLTAAERSRLLDTAMLRYALALAPDTFARHLRTGEDGLVDVLSLPARNDPIYARVQRLRESEYLFADSVDAHYQSLHARLGETYDWWRRLSHELITGNEALQRKDQTRGASRGTWHAIDRIYESYRETKLNEDALREVAESFARETRPIVTRIAGQVVELEGTAAFQYEEWRRLLQEIYQQDQ